MRKIVEAARDLIESEYRLTGGKDKSREQLRALRGSILAGLLETLRDALREYDAKDHTYPRTWGD